MTIFEVAIPRMHSAVDPCLLYTPEASHTGSISNRKPEDARIATETNVNLLMLRVYTARVVWNGLRPLFFDGSVAQARRALYCLLLLSESNSTGSFSASRNEEAALAQESSIGRESASLNRSDNSPNGQTIQREEAHPQSSSPVTIQTRRVPLRSTLFSSNTRWHNHQRKEKRNILVWIQPPDSVPLESTFSGLVIQWEHRMIQAQSLSGYIATLGGGFFLCHHFQTAIRLAQFQQRMALLLHDEPMYYTCAIHQAYSHIYAGHFGTARSMLRQIRHILQPSPVETKTPAHPVLIQMCRSALLFCKRMRRASIPVGDTAVSESEYTKRMRPSMALRDNSSPTEDDFQRIRVVQDKSKVNDLVIPFARASSC